MFSVNSLSFAGQDTVLKQFESPPLGVGAARPSPVLGLLPSHLGLVDHALRAFPFSLVSRFGVASLLKTTVGGFVTLTLNEAERGSEDC